MYIALLYSHLCKVWYLLSQATYTGFAKHLGINAARGLRRMYTSLDCMHYEWKDCLVAWQGDFGNRNGKKSIILEAIVDQSLHIWHVVYELLGSNNNVNILNHSSLVLNMLIKPAYGITFIINVQKYNWC